MRLVVAGSHTTTERKPVWRKLDEIHAATPIDVIIEGDAPGVDRFAGAWAAEHGICGIKVPAQWHRMGKRAGPVRNGWMLKYCAPDAVAVFPGGQGTANMAAQAEAAGLRIMDFRAHDAKLVAVDTQQPIGSARDCASDRTSSA